jgi:Sec-independent protein translocase protein TatA
MFILFLPENPMSWILIVGVTFLLFGGSKLPQLARLTLLSREIRMNTQQPELTTYGFSKTVDLSYAEVVEKTRSALKEQGFGVLCEIDIKEKLKEKLGVDFRNYLILGACNPPLAYETLQQEINIGCFYRAT